MESTKVTIEGIEFYVAGDKCGMSGSALARLCGVAQSSVSRLISKISYAQNVPEILESFVGQEVSVMREAEKNTTIYKSDLCFAICVHYAFNNKIAQQHTLKIGKIGLDQWIRSVAAPGFSTVTTEAFDKLLADFNEFGLKVKAQGAGLELMLDAPLTSEDPRIMYSLSDWLLIEKRIMFKHCGQDVKSRFSGLVAATVKAHGLRPVGKRRGINRYPRSYFSVLDACWHLALMGGGLIYDCSYNPSTGSVTGHVYCDPNVDTLRRVE